MKSQWSCGFTPSFPRKEVWESLSSKVSCSVVPVTCKLKSREMAVWKPLNPVEAAKQPSVPGRVSSYRGSQLPEEHPRGWGHLNDQIPGRMQWSHNCPHVDSQQWLMARPLVMAFCRHSWKHWAWESSFLRAHISIHNLKGRRGRGRKEEERERENENWESEESVEISKPAPINTFPNPPQPVPPTVDQAFRYMSLWRLISSKPPQ